MSSAIIQFPTARRPVNTTGAVPSIPGTLDSYFPPRYIPFSMTYTQNWPGQIFGNSQTDPSPMEIKLEKVLEHVDFYVYVDGPSTPRAQTEVRFELFDVNGVKLGEMYPRISRSTFLTAVAVVGPNAGTYNALGQYVVASPIKKIRITAPIDLNLAFVTELGVPATSKITWKNGVTRQILPGNPPPGWYLAPDDWWYPEDVVSDDFPPDYEGEIPESIDDTISVEAPTVHLTYRVRITTAVLPSTKWIGYKIRMTVLPGKSEIAPVAVNVPVRLTINPIPLPLRRAFMDEFRVRLAGKIDSFYDEDRVLKTLMNFGDDRQHLLTNWKRAEDGQSLLLKTYQPLSYQIAEDDEFFISRELSPPLIDLIFVVDASLPLRVYLRPPNHRIKLTNVYGSIRKNATLENLLSTGSFDIINPSDRIVEDWFGTPLEGAELNIDYSNYGNFVFYSSAQQRLNAFKNKLLRIEDLNAAILIHSESLSSLTGHITGSQPYLTIQSYVQERQDIYRSFDPYERFLYYEENIPFSGTFTKYPEYNPGDPDYDYTDVTWPKISGSIAPYASASSWYSAQMELAGEYDDWNINRFVNNIPSYLRDDRDSSEFLAFMDMVGHMFDTVKLYSDHMSLMYDRSNNPNTGLSKDIVWNVARSFGLELPNQYSLNTLSSYVIPSGSSLTYRDYAAETWKRFLHNHVYLTKTKGTKTALRGLLNVYGVLPTTVQIRETIAPSYFYATQSFETFEEPTNTLNMESGSFISIPWKSNTPVNFQIRFSTTTVGTDQVILQGDTDWALKLLADDDDYYRVAVEHNSLVTLESPSYQIGNGDYYTVMVQSSTDSASLFVNRSDDDGDLLVNFTVSETGSGGLPSVWADPDTVYLGASGSTFGMPFIGEIDEFRVWGETISEETFDRWTRYPGLYNGETPTSARDYLWVRLSFNKPKNLGGPTSQDKKIANESPYQRLDSAPSSMDMFSASFFANEPNYPYSFTTVTRTSQRLSPSAGGMQFDTNKIIIADDPVFEYYSGSNVPVLSRKNSIVSLQEKEDTYSRNSNLVGFYFSPTEGINDSIMRVLGNIDLHDYVGDPRDQYEESYSALKELNDFYWKYYAYQISINEFLDFVKDILNPLFDQAERLVPVRAKLLTGIVIEPHILERNKFPLKPLGMDRSGDYAAEPVVSNPDTSNATVDDWKVEISTEDLAPIEAKQTDSSAELEPEIITALEATYVNLVDIIDTQEDLSEPIANYTNYTDFINTQEVLEDYIIADRKEWDADIDLYYEVFTQSSIAYKRALDDGLLVSEEFLLPTITSYSDIENDIGARTYFTDPNGLVGVIEYQRVRRRQNVLTNQGTWVAGSIYNKDDYVEQGNIIDSDASPGNGKEFYAISDNFISNVPPYLDRTNWRPVAYVTRQVGVIKQVAEIDGELSIVPSGSSLPPFVGYRPNHYIHYRPNETGYVNSRYRGCVQTSDTTFDGKPPVEVLDSASDELYVRNRGGVPVVPVDDASGPILDVT